MQQFSLKRLRIGVLNAALKEIGARLIGKAHSSNFGHSRKYFGEINQNISENSINIFLYLIVKIAIVT